MNTCTTDKKKKDVYVWWAAPAIILMFSLWFILALIGVPLSIAFGINVVYVFGFWIFYSVFG